jgi:DnaJ-class molecular chaperone
MQRKDYYAILGVARDAGESEIKNAYRKLALQHHPDTNRGDPHAEDRFKEINEAYEILGHRDKRQQYDLGQDPLAGAFPFPPPPFDSWSDPFEESFFSAFRCRGGGLARTLGRRGRNFRGTRTQPTGFVRDGSNFPVQDLRLTTNEALRGAERDLRIHTGVKTEIFTVSIPAGVKDGTLLNFKRLLGDGLEIKLQFRVRIMESSAMNARA